MCRGWGQPSKSARWSVFCNAWFILYWLWFTVCGFKSHSERWGRVKVSWFIGVFHQRTPKCSSRAHWVTLTFSASNLSKRPAELIVSSVQPFMGDNYCDANNNRAFCNYDGGDCCQSTVKTKKVSGAAWWGFMGGFALTYSRCLLPNLGVRKELRQAHSLHAFSPLHIHLG